MYTDQDRVLWPPPEPKSCFLSVVLHLKNRLMLHLYSQQVTKFYLDWGLVGREGGREKSHTLPQGPCVNTVLEAWSIFALIQHSRHFEWQDQVLQKRQSLERVDNITLCKSHISDTQWLGLYTGEVLPPRGITLWPKRTWSSYISMHSSSLPPHTTAREQ